MSAAEVPTLRGRADECAEVDLLLREAGEGRSQVLVLRGEPGIGKTVLLDYASVTARDSLVLRATGVESEIGFPFSGLHQLCAPLLEHLDLLPAPQRQALAVAFGLTSGEPPDRFHVGVAVLTLLAHGSESRSLLCLVDDAHWLDPVSMQLVGFLLRRLLAERIAFVVALRDTFDLPELRGLATRHIRGLGHADSVALLGTAISSGMERGVVDRLLAETAGNPLAIVELRNRRDLSELVFSGGSSTAASRPSRMELTFAEQIRGLPRDAQRLLAIAAAEPSAGVDMIWEAAARLGVPVDLAAGLERMDLIEIGTSVRFRHPLIRSAAYRTPDAAERRRIHGALADVTDQSQDPDRRAWHRAQAAWGPDDAVADEVASSAGRARARGGWAAAATFLTRAALLTQDPSRRAERELAGAEAQRQAGSLDAALGLLASAETGPPDDRRIAEAALLRAMIAMDRRQGVEASGRFLEAARLFEGIDPGAARRAQLQALSAALWAGRGDGVDNQIVVAEAVRSFRRPGPAGRGLMDMTLEALSGRFIEGYASSAELVGSVLQQFLEIDPAAGDDEVRWLWHAGRRAVAVLCMDLWDDERWHTFGTRQLQLLRQLGAPVQVQFPLYYVSMNHLLTGDLAAAAHLMDEDAAIAEATGSPGMAHISMAIAAWRGDAAAFQPHHDQALEEATARGQAGHLAFTQAAAAVLHNGQGDHEVAHEHALAAFRADVIGNSAFVIPEIIESAHATGDTRTLEDVLGWLEERTTATPTPLLLGIECRVRALLSDEDAADRHHLDSVGHLARTRSRAQQARGELLRGRSLRRMGRREEAVRPLRTAFAMLNQMGMEGFAGQAARELQAIGHRPPIRGGRAPVAALTPQEVRIALLARDGLTNAEIGGQLFLSPRTVEWHLRKVFEKLHVRTRRELRQPMIDAGFGHDGHPHPDLAQA